MRNWMMAFIAACLTVGPSAAHEFWIEPREFTMPSGGAFEPRVRVGEHLAGRAYPFAAKGYETALWVGPDGTKVLSTGGHRGQIPTLQALGEGLHVLAVASYPQKHVYETAADFLDFVAEIHAEDALTEVPEAMTSGQLKESYRRFSKTLVHFGKRQGTDRKIGLAREWVKSGDGFTLFRDGVPVPHQPVKLFCQLEHSGHHHTREVELITDAKGMVAPDLPSRSTCLLNTVFLRPTEVAGHWSSDWVSMFWQT